MENAERKSDVPRSARLHSKSRDELSRVRAQVLAESASKLLAGEDPDAIVMPALYRSLAAEHLIDATLGFVVVEGSDTMRLGFMEGFDEEMIRRCLRLDFGQAICGTVAATRQAMHVTNIQRSLDPIADLVRGGGINAYACEPLIVADRILGTLSFASRSRRSFDAEDLAFFRAIAKHVAIARDKASRTSG